LRWTVVGLIVAAFGLAAASAAPHPAVTESGSRIGTSGNGPRIAFGAPFGTIAPFTQAFTIVPLFLLGYSGGVFAGAAVVVTLLAILQHANVRLTFPILRWVIPTPEWHHWHHALDDEAVNKNFGLPVVDKIFGTAYMLRGQVPRGSGIHDPVPQDGYLVQIAYPFTNAARTRATGQASST
jgi:hypothetical protein